MLTPQRDTRSIIEAYVDAHRTGDVSRLAEIIVPDFRYRDGKTVGVEGVAAGVRATRPAVIRVAED